MTLAQFYNDDLHFIKGKMVNGRTDLRAATGGERVLVAVRRPAPTFNFPISCGVDPRVRAGQSLLAHAD